MIRARIIGTGEFLPEKVLTNFDLEKFVDTSDEWIRQRTGIHQRHIAEPGEATSDLMARAVKNALDDAGIHPEQVDCIIGCTVTPDYLFPATASVVQAKVGAKNAACHDLNAACSGFLYGLATASAWIQIGLYKTAVVAGAELVSNRLIWKNRDTGVLFGDGAGAVVLQAQEGDHGVLAMYLGSDGCAGETLIMPMGGSKEPTTPENIHKEPFTIVMKGQDLFKRAVIAMPLACQKVLDATGLTVDDIALFIPHQANVRILEAAADRLKLPREKMVVNMDKVANTVAASIPLALHQAKVDGRFKEGDYLLFASFGAGLTWGASIVKW